MTDLNLLGVFVLYLSHICLHINVILPSPSRSSKSSSQLYISNVKLFTSSGMLCTPFISLILLTLWLKIVDCSRYSKYSLLLIIAFQTSYIAAVSRQLSPLVILTPRLVQQLVVPVNAFPATS